MNELIYVKSRRELLGAVVAMKPHQDQIVLVGSHAIYLRVGNSGLAVAPFTADGDLMLDPTALGQGPSIRSLLEARGFQRGEQPGSWRGPNGCARRQRSTLARTALG